MMMRLARLALAAAVAVALQADGAEARACVLPAYASGPPGSPVAAEKCKKSEDCCGDLVCNDDEQCVPAGKENMTAKESAYVAHLVIEDCVNHAVAMSLDLESASQAIANASHAVKNAAGKAKDNFNKAMDKASDKAKEIAGKIKDEKDKKSAQASQKADQTKAKANDAKNSAKDAATKASASAKDNFQHAKDKTTKTMDDLKQKSNAILASTTQHFVNMKAKASGTASTGGSGGAGAGFDYQKYMPGSKASSKTVNMKADASGSAGSAGAGGASAGADFDKFYKSYMKGAGGSPSGSTKSDSKSAKGGASTGGAGGAGGGFDYQKYVPGSKDSSKTVNMKKKDDASASGGTTTGGAGGAGAGFDYQKYVPGSKDSSKTANMKKKKDDASASTGGAGGAGAGFDYQKYVPGSKDSSKMVNMKKKDDKNATKTSAGGAASTGGAGGAGGGFDYQKFIPGGGGDKDDKGKKSKSKGSAGASTGGAGGAGGGFDYQKFIPGGSSKMVNMKASNPGGAQGGFDYSKFTGQKLANMAASANAGAGAGGSGGAGAGFDWKKFIPAGTPAGADNKTSTPGLSGTVPEKDSSKTNLTKSSGKADDTGGDGAPCGVTPYKDFGTCKKAFKCETHPLFTSFAPGKCVKKPKRRMLRELAAVDMAVVTPGGMSGPCGVWKLGGMDFGGCKDDLECVEQDQVSLTFYGKTYGLPNVCKNASEVEHYEYTAVEQAAVTNDDVSADSDDDDGPVDVDAVRKAAHDVADKANAAALKAADEAELLAQKLLAAVAQVRTAAKQLAKEAAGNTTTTDDGVQKDTSSSAAFSMIEIPMEAARSNFVAFSIGGLVLGTAALIYRQTADARSYSRI